MALVHLNGNSGQGPSLWAVTPLRAVSLLPHSHPQPPRAMTAHPACVGTRAPAHLLGGPLPCAPNPFRPHSHPAPLRPHSHPNPLRPRSPPHPLRPHSLTRPAHPTRTRPTSSSHMRNKSPPSAANTNPTLSALHTVGPQHNPLTVGPPYCRPSTQPHTVGPIYLEWDTG